MPPFFSLVTATYNRAKLLPRTIDSMLCQSFSDFEILLVDDGSTDETEQVIHSRYSGEKRLRYIKQANQERGAARNTGIKNATGKYLVFIDSDDTLDPMHLHKLHRHIHLLGEPDFITAKYDIVENGRCKSAPIARLKEGWYDYHILLSGNILGMYCAAKRTNPGLIYFLEDRKYSIMEDWIFNFENLRNNSIYITNDTTYHLNHHEERSMVSDHHQIIQRKESAKKHICTTIDLTQQEREILEGDFLVFASIHSYLASERTDALDYLRKAVKFQGLSSGHILLWLKIMLGRERLAQLKATLRIP